MIGKQTSVFRLLLLADPAVATPLSSLQGGETLASWELVPVSNLEQARFMQQWDPCDAILVDQPRGAEAEPDHLALLSYPRRTPLVVLSDTPQAQAGLPAGAHAGVRRALPCGQAPQHWLPRRLALDHPAILAVVLGQAAEHAELARRTRQREEELQGCRRQVRHLVELLWQGLPGQNPAPWFTQRQMVERLHEEVTRSRRYGDTLTVVLGELSASPQQPVEGLDPGELAAWLARHLTRHKRSCDVAGQYGPHGFLLLLPQTSESAALRCCRRLLPMLEKTDDLPPGAHAAPALRVGIAGFSPTTATVTSLLARAEEQLEQARLGSLEKLSSN